jgi:hypothetical protein
MEREEYRTYINIDIVTRGEAISFLEEEARGKK